MLELPFARWHEESCALDQSLLALIFVIRSLPNRFQNSYVAGPGGIKLKNWLDILLFTAGKKPVNWPLQENINFVRDKVRNMWNDEADRRTPIGGTSEVDRLIKWLLPERLGWTTVTYTATMTCSNQECKEQYQSTGSIESYFHEVLYPTQPESLVFVMRGPPIVKSPSYTRF